jgi:hypothetical protein
MMIVELLEKVHDRESFLAFAYAFAEERRRVEGIEAANPDAYQWGGAEGWNDNCISLFVEGGLSHFEPGDGKQDTTDNGGQVGEWDGPILLRAKLSLGCGAKSRRFPAVLG